MQKTVLLIGNTKSRSVQRLKEEAARLGIVFDVVAPKHVSYDGRMVYVEAGSIPRDVLAYDVYLFRGMGVAGEKALQPIAAFLAAEGKRVVEDCFTRGMLPIDKEVPISLEGTYRIPTTRVVTKETYEDALPNFTFPVVTKELYSSMGRGVQKIDSPDALMDYMKSVNGNILLQQYHDIDFDTRVLVVGDKVLGGLRRYKKDDGDFLTTRPGGLREAAVLTDGEIRAMQEVHAHKGLEIAGIDMFTDNGETYIIEVNASPQFRVFEKHTGINVAKEILEYIVR